MKTARGSFLKLAIGVALGCVVLSIVGYAMLRRYLHGDSFRKFLSAEVSRATGMAGEFGQFRWVGLAVDTDSFQATGSGGIAAIRANGLHTEVSLAGVRRGVWEIQGSSLQRLEIEVDGTRELPKATASVVEKTAQVRHDSPSWLPKKAEFKGISVRELAAKVKLSQGVATADGVSLQVSQLATPGAYRAEAKAGVIRLPFKLLPEIRLDQVTLRSQGDQVFLTNAALSMWDNGRLNATGECDLKSRQFTCEGEVSGMTCENVFSENWAKRLTGNVKSTFMLDNRSGALSAAGKWVIDGGVLTALPMLDALAAYADTRRFRVLPLSEAHSQWRWHEDELVLTELVLASEGSVRLEGNLHIRDRALMGDFRLGLAPGTLARIPGAETDVFTLGERGLLWTPVRVTGSLDDPKEDLTDRLIAAAGLRMLEKIPETGEQVLRFSRSVIGENHQEMIEKGLKAIEKNAELIEEVSGVLDQLLGKDTAPVAPQP